MGGRGFSRGVVGLGGAELGLWAGTGGGGLRGWLEGEEWWWWWMTLCLIGNICVAFYWHSMEFFVPSFFLFEPLVMWEFHSPFGCPFYIYIFIGGHLFWYEYEYEYGMACNTL